jgi:ABC-type uncharacterized transport system auxiliary subunit
MTNRVVFVGLVGLIAAGCSGTLHDTRYYQLAAPASPPQPGEATLVLEPLSTDTAYDDERIVYRTTPYRLDYYQYHRWSAAPGVMVGNYLEQAFERSGRFRSVTRELSNEAPAVLSGRVVAIEEVDSAKTRWQGHIVLELTLTDAKTNETLWTRQFDESEPLPTQNAEGLARALTVAMTRIMATAAPIVADLSERQARIHAQQPTPPKTASRATR